MMTDETGVLDDERFGDIEQVSHDDETEVEQVAPPEEQEQSETPKASSYKTVNLNIHLSKSPREPANEKTKRLMTDGFRALLGQDDEGEPTLLGNVSAYIQLDQQDYAKLSAAFPNLELDPIYLDLLRSASNLFIGGNVFADSLAREGSNWHQGLKIADKYYNLFKPVVGERKGALLTGEAALLRVKSITNQGHVYSIPLWNSGIYVSIKTPTNERLLELEETLAQQKVEIGRFTNGLIYSNDSVLLNQILLDFALEHVYSSTLPLTSPETLLATIKLPDMDKLIMALAVAVWIDGYPFKRTCAADPTKCTHVEDELIHLSRLFWVDNSVFNAAQERIIARRDRQQITSAELSEYQAAFNFNNPEFTMVPVTDIVTLELEVPSIAKYLVSGTRWIDGLAKLAEKTMGSRSERERAAYMLKQSQITALQKYAHYFKAIIVKNGDTEEVYDDQNIIAEMLQGFTSDPAVFDLIMEAIGKFINKIAVCVVGIPTFNCSNCGEEQTDLEKNNPHVIPLEVNRLFFTLNTQHLSRIIAR